MTFLSCHFVFGSYCLDYGAHLGGAIVFVALLKEFAIGHRLRKFQWVGVFWNLVSIILVGLTALLSSSKGSGVPSESAPQDSALTGVVLILAGAFVQSLQYAFGELYLFLLVQ